MAVIDFIGKTLIALKDLAVEMWFLNKRVKKLEIAMTNQVSTEAKFCPNCDARMRATDTRRFDFWWYRCGKCNETFHYPAPTITAR